MNDHLIPCRVRKPLFTHGVIILLSFMAVGFTFGLARFLTGLGAVTNLTDQYAWGIWIAIDVACGVALAAGGFTTAALIEVFGRRRYQPLLRPAILTAWLGYTMVAFALMFDLGRYWNMWQVIFNWQGNSVLFEVAMCVMGYLAVLTFEMAPPLLEGFLERADGDEWGAALLRPLVRPLRMAQAAVRTMLPLFIIAGVVLSCMHQSSLGTLWVLVPTKLSPFWYTPFLPVLFLLSAIMIGFPMVILESIIASKSLGRKPEMDLLAPLARKIPWFIGVYGVVLYATLVARWDSLDPFLHPGCTLALGVEIVGGLVAPFVLLLFRTVRRSPGWLFFASLLVILGVVMNRVNVYLVGYHPVYEGRGYFPAIGEIAVTVAIICFIMFLYRVVITFFPIWSGPECVYERAPAGPGEPVSPFWAWFFRGVAAVLLLGFALLYATTHRVSQAEAREARQKVYAPPSAAVEAPARVEVVRHTQRPREYQTLYMLDSAVLRERNDDYEPARFSHRSHDNAYDGNCAVCHHRTAFHDPEDRVGQDMQELHAMMEIRLGPACSSCHGDMEDHQPEGCAHCHRLPNEADNPARPGLQGAYHRQCIGCHEGLPAASEVPTDCSGCHHPKTPDHAELVQFAGEPDDREVTAKCLECHEEVGEDILESAHWKLHGHSPMVVGHEHDTRLGRRTVLNNYMIGTTPNPELCGGCHIGTGHTEEPFDYDDPAGIDCLVCHDTTGTYVKAPAGGGRPAGSPSLASVAAAVGRPGRENCGLCHFSCSGGPNAKHGDLEPILADPPPDFDVHMGRYNLRCQDCHTTHRHRIAGHSLSAPAAEGHIFCERCHGDRPHRITGMLGAHLDDHVRTVACETCHIPFMARETPTQVFLDYSAAGRDREDTFDEHGRPTYDRKLGAMEWAKNLVPTYAWYDHTHEAYVLGDKISPYGVVSLNAPMGSKEDPASKVHPFKVHNAVQPYDKEEKILVVPKFEGGYWVHFDWDRAIREGMEAVGVPYSGSHGFVETRMVHAVHHGVVPAGRALGCADCHGAEAIGCVRCHSAAEGMDLPGHREKVYPEVERFLDFEALGYEDDPALIGGRFTVSLGRGRPVR